MTQPSKIGLLFLKPYYQACMVAGMMIILTLLDNFMPQNNEFFNVNAGPWIVSTAMVLLFIILNTVVALRVKLFVPYWITSIVCFIALLAFAYGWSYLLTGKHIDDVGSFRWLWMVLTLVYFVFFIIVRSMKTIVDFAIRQDNKLRGEE